MKLRISIDGGSRGNPGPAACGVAIDQVTDTVLVPITQVGFFLGRLTNNVAEYHGLLRALELADKLKPGDIEIVSDSQLMVMQVTGQYKVKAPQLKPLVEQARQQLQRFAKWSIRHVYREANTRADQLANLAMDQKRDVWVIRDGQRVAPDSGHDRTEKVDHAARTTSSPAHTQPAFQCETPVEKPHRPRKVLVEYLRDPPKQCPVTGAQEHHFAFTDVTPPGMCIHAANLVLNALTSDGPLPDRLVCRQCKLPMSVTEL